MQTNSENISGRISINGDRAIYMRENKIKYEIYLPSVKVIGEFTTNADPYLDDWFLTIVTTDYWAEVPMYADGMDEFREHLGNIINAKLTLELASSTRWKARIIYPESAKGMELYEFTKSVPQNPWQQFLKLIGLLGNTRSLSTITKELAGW